jgi:serine/threonine-protein kinase RIO1
MTWTEYIIKAAQHSRGSAAHWFRYLRKDIDNLGTLFTQKDVDDLVQNEELTYFQRVSLKAAFEEGSPTRQHIINLNKPARLQMVSQVKDMVKKRENRL